MLLHASCVSIDGKGVLISGPPGSGTGAGKSDLALRLIDEGAQLVADDQVALSAEKGALIATPPATIAGLMEVRHVGLLKLPHAPRTAIALYVELMPPEEKIERLPEAMTKEFLGIAILCVRLPPFAASTPAKIRAVLIYPSAE